MGLMTWLLLLLLLPLALGWLGLSCSILVRQQSHQALVLQMLGRPAPCCCCWGTTAPTLLLLLLLLLATAIGHLQQPVITSHSAVKLPLLLLLLLLHQ
jgi:hypothetical protein